MKISVSDLSPNPYRDLKRLPLDPEKVEALTHSIKETSFWDNLLGRKANGGVEIAYGHHRIAALKKARVQEIDIVVRPLTNTEMAKIMAHENMAEWTHDAANEVETVRSVLAAYGAGEIELPKVNGGQKARKVYSSSSRNKADGAAYTVETLAEFLGWKPYKVESALSVLSAQEDDTLDPSTLSELSSKQAQIVVNQVRRVAKETGDKVKAKKVGAYLAGGMRKGSGGRYKKGDAGRAAVTIHSAKRVTDELMGKYKTEPKAKKIPDVNEFAAQVLAALEDSFKGKAKERMDTMVQFRDHIRQQLIDRLVKALRQEAKNSERYAEALATPVADLSRRLTKE